MTTDPHFLDDGYWSKLYDSRQTGWDIGAASTPLVAYMQQIPDRQIRILIPGCGNAWEANALLQMGFQHITLIDLSKTLVQQLQMRYANKPIQIIHGDFFAHSGEYDLILEQTFLCALDPRLRARYAMHTSHLLADNGRLAGVLFNRQFEGGPPFGGSVAEYEQLLKPYYQIKSLSTCYNSIEPRAGNEVFLIAKKLSRP